MEGEEAEKNGEGVVGGADACWLQRGVEARKCVCCVVCVVCCVVVVVVVVVMCCWLFVVVGLGFWLAVSVV